MRRRLFRFVVFAALGALLASAVHFWFSRHPVGVTKTFGELEIHSAYAVAPPPGVDTAAAYLTLRNRGKAPDLLMTVRSDAAGTSAVHQTLSDGGVMKMRAVEGGLALPPGESIEMAPGGKHLMFMQLARAIEPGSTLAVTLVFRDAGEVDLLLPVRDTAGGLHRH